MWYYIQPYVSFVALLVVLAVVGRWMFRTRGKGVWLRLFPRVFRRDCGAVAERIHQRHVQLKDSACQ